MCPGVYVPCMFLPLLVSDSDLPGHVVAFQYKGYEHATYD
jgi:hypothetical protein